MTTSPRVLLLGDRLLRERSSNVFSDDASPLESDALQEFEQCKSDLAAALNAFRSENGFGRAVSANQVGWLKKVIACNLGNDERSWHPPATFFLVDPIVTWHSNETFRLWDDCMSFPWLMVRVSRFTSISISYVDGSSGERKKAENLDQATSELLQHEFDHLDGILSVDRAEDVRTDIIARESFEADRPRFDAMVDYTIQPTISVLEQTRSWSPTVRN